MKEKSEAEKKTNDKILKRGTLLCPCHKEPLWFKNYAGMRLVEDGYYSAHCHMNESAYFLVIADKQNKK